MDNSCTLLVCSCDKYDDCWEPFFKLLKIQWRQMDFPVLLNTESKSFEYEGFDIRTLGLYKNGENPPWGERMLAHLAAVKTEYVLVMLDDFFLCKSADDARIRRCIGALEKNKDVATFCFYKIPGTNIADGRFESFERRSQRGDYKYNLQAGLWRTKELASFIRAHESPWVWEVAANYRACRSKQSFYCAADGNDLALDYYGGTDWSGVMRGRWYLPNVEPLFKKYGIEVDFSLRGTIGDDEVGAIVREQDNKALFALKRLYGNVKCLLQNPRSIF